MKLLYVFIVTFSFLLRLNAAQYAIFNAQGGAGVDTLWANADGTLMDGTGFVTMGYFTDGTTDNDINSISKLVAKLSDFTALQTSTPNVATTDPLPETIFTEPGYIGNDFLDTADILTGNALLDRRLYAIASDASSIATASTSNTFSLFFIDTIKEDVPEQSYIANPAGITPIIGEVDVIIGHDSGNFGVGDYDTLKMVAIPEPTTALLVAFGSLALLRRRREVEG
jgi:hypothetical protein